MDVKDIRLQFINSKVANDFVRKYHYSGKVASNSQLHIGAFYKDKGVILPGFQLRYIYFIDKTYKEKLTVPILPFSKIKEMGAGMYKGVKTCPDGVNSNTSDYQSENGGATPTSGLLYTKNASES